MNDNLLTSEVLDLAADAIQSRGWTQFNGWDAEPGSWADGLVGDASGGLCLEGGIMAAMGLRVGETDFAIEKAKTCPAYAAVHDYLGGDRRLFMWNDAPDRTEAEVIEVLRAAAAVERAKEAVYSDEDTPLPVEVAA